MALPAAGSVHWEATSGLLPTEISPPWALVDSASPENPVLGSQFLTLSTDQASENIFYIHTGPAVNSITVAPFYIEAVVRFVSGSSSAARAPVIIGLTTAPNVGNALFIRDDEVFFNTGEFDEGLSVEVDTNDAFHTYRIEVTPATGSLSLFYDGAPILTGQTFNNAAFNGPTQRVLWGEASSLAFGASEWASVTFGSSIPEPSSILVFGLLLTIAASRVSCGRCGVGVVAR
jgi:hypothetical protein